MFDLGTMLSNLQASFDSLAALVATIAFIIGFTLVVRGIMMYSVLGRQTMSSAQRGELAGPLVHIIVGTILMWFQSTMDTSLTTIFGSKEIASSSDLTAYASLSATEKWKEISTVIVQYMKLIGLIAFVRGWVILSKMGHSGAQPGSMGKGIIHVVGGILLINIVDTMKILAETFGYTGG